MDLSDIRNYVISLVQQAGKIQTGLFNKQSLQSVNKGRFDIVTEADSRTDEFLTKELTKKYPTIPLLSEETSPSDYFTFRTNKYYWVIDPLDGSVNFSRGYPHYAISIALVHYNEPVLAVVCTPVNKGLYWAQEDIPHAYYQDKRISVSSKSTLDVSILGTDWSHNMEKRKEVVGYIDDLCQKVKQIKMNGSAVADLMLVAKGNLDGYFHPGLKPWDMAAGILIIEKAGGIVSRPDGTKVDIYSPGLIATNGHLHKRMIDILNK